MRRWFWLGATALLLATGVAAAATPHFSGDAKLDTHLRPRAVAPSASVLEPLTPKGSKARVFVHVTSTEAADLAALRRAGLRIDRVAAGHGLVRGRIRKKDLRRLA